MIYLTRGITLYYDPTRRTLSPGPVPTLSLDVVRLKLWLTLAGEPDPKTGMLINVADIKRTVCESLAQYAGEGTTAFSLLNWCMAALKNKFPRFILTQINLDLADRITATLSAGDTNMIEITTIYELAASHRLRNPQWDDSQNFDAFGKCGNPAGHGHNYKIEITLQGKPDKHTGQLADVGSVDQIVDRNILARFDHKNLNTDCPEFRDLLPTVENMTKVFWELLDGKFGPAQLRRVRVWETANTYADYFGPAQGPLRFSDAV